MFSKVTLVIADMNDESDIFIERDVGNVLRENGIRDRMLISNDGVPKQLEVVLAREASPEQADNASIQLRSTFQIDKIEWE